MAASLAAWLPRFALDGSRLWEVDVPALSPDYLRMSVYMYPTHKAAEDGIKAGGSGFLLGVPSAQDESFYPYVVTNAHVVEAGNLVIRLNRADGGVDGIDTDLSQWTIGTEDDLAVCSLPPLGEGRHAGKFIMVDKMFLDEDCLIDGWPVFPGDNVLFLGRFVGHDGTQRNKPVVRFGNIAMLPDPDALIDLGPRKQLGFLVECRSLSGFSGSPAFVHLEQPRMMAKKDDKRGLIPDRYVFLGVDCAHLPFWSPVREERRPDAPTMSRAWVETNSAMAVVVPAWRLKALLNQEHLVKQREQAWKEYQKAERAAAAAVPDATIDADDDEPFTKDDFERALKRVAKKLPDSETTQTSDD